MDQSLDFDNLKKTLEQKHLADFENYKSKVINKLWKLKTEKEKNEKEINEKYKKHLDQKDKEIDQLKSLIEDLQKMMKQGNSGSYVNEMSLELEKKKMQIEKQEIIVKM